MKTEHLLTDGTKHRLEITTCATCGREYYYVKEEPEVGLEDVFTTKEEAEKHMAALAHFSKDSCICGSCIDVLRSSLAPDKG